MRIRISLDQILRDKFPTLRGLVARISKNTKIERHRIAALCNGRAKNISLKSLGKVCSYLADEMQIPPEHLLSRLLTVQPNDVQGLLRRRQILTTCFGVRQNRNDPDARLSTVADTYLSGKLIEWLFRPETSGGAQRTEAAVSKSGGEARSSDRRSSRALTASVPGFREFHQELIPAFQPPQSASGRDSMDPLDLTEQLASVKQTAESKYKALQELRHASTLVLGSIKSNPICELIAARVFKAPAWKRMGMQQTLAREPGSRQTVDKPSMRAVPFFLRYRHGKDQDKCDPQIPSCHAGLKLSEEPVPCGNDGSLPGIYYETRTGDWDFLPSNKKEDVAVILIEESVADDRVEVVLGGFSGDATLALAEHLEETFDQINVSDLVPVDAKQNVGVFLVRFHYKPAAEGGLAGADVAARPVIDGEPEVIALHRSVYDRRFPFAKEDSTRQAAEKRKGAHPERRKKGLKKGTSARRKPRGP